MEWLREIKRKHEARKRSRSATPVTLSPNTSSPSIPQQGGASSLDESSVPLNLWNEAYNQLKTSEKDITDAYEKILSYTLEHPDSDQVDLSSQTNNIAQTPERWRQMNQIIQAGLKKTEKEAAIKQKIDNGIQAIQSVQTLVASAVESCPQASIAWAGVSLAIKVRLLLPDIVHGLTVKQILSGPFSESVANRQGITYVLTRMDWYWNLSGLLLNKNRGQTASEGLRNELEKHIVGLYKKLLLFEMKTICLYHRNRAVVVLRDLIQLDQWDASLDEIHSSEEEIRQDSEQYNTQEIRLTLENTYSVAKMQESKLGDIHAAILQTAQSAEDTKCLRDLRVTDPADDKERIESEKGRLLKDSYKWILDNPDFCLWRTDPGHRLLWINGDPGKGKTMLLCGIIEELMRLSSAQDGPPLSFFFCQATDDRINNATAILRGLIYHLAKQRRSLLAHVREAYDVSGEDLFKVNAWFAMCRIFEKILQDPVMENAIIVVDALDECSEASLPLFLDFVAEHITSSRVKWILSSRRENYIGQKLNSNRIQGLLCLELNNALAIQDAVKSYICRKAEDLEQKKYYSPEAVKIVKEYLIENSNNTFLWVALVCHELSRPGHSERHMMQDLHSFPPGLRPLYGRMFRRIYSWDIDLCKQILALAAIARRPLTIAELPALVEPLGKFDSKCLEEIIQACGSFLDLRGNVVSFIHQSAKDFLLKDIRNEIFPLGIEDTHEKTFFRSLEILHKVLKRDIYSLREPGSPIDEVSVPSPDPLDTARYSCVYWVDHLCESCSSMENVNDNQKSGDVVHKFFEEKYLYWLEALSLLQAMSGGVAAIRKLEDLVSFLSPRMVHFDPE